MSGPKYSQAELIERERTRLEEERKTKLEIIRCELEESKKQLRNEYKKLKELKSEMFLSIKDAPISDYYVEEINKLISQIENINIDISGDRDAIENRTKQVKELIERFIQNQKKILHKAREYNIINDISVASKKEQCATGNITFSENIKLDKYYEIVESSRLVDDVLERDKKIIRDSCNQILAKLEVARKEDLFEIKELCRRLNSKIFQARKMYVRMLDEYDQYACCMQLAGYKAKLIEEFEDAETIHEEVIRIERILSEKEKLEYISSVISEVMVECGHDVIRSDVMIPNKDDKVCNFLYELGDEGAINVTISRDGGLIMEVAVTGEDENFLEIEKEHSVDMMLEFCHQYPEIIDKLRDKGIVFSNMENMPPDKAFAKKIVCERKHKTRGMQRHKQLRRRNEQLHKDM